MVLYECKDCEHVECYIDGIMHKRANQLCVLVVIVSLCGAIRMLVVIVSLCGAIRMLVVIVSLLTLYVC